MLKILFVQYANYWKRDLQSENVSILARYHYAAI